jgi:hypothetical protein
LSYYLNRQELLRLARLGATARLAELARERKAIESLLESASRRPRRGRRFSTAAERGATASERTRRRRGMSAAQRKAVSDRMKKYWAKRRSQKK